ncbi:MAG: Wzz/FepE/Etk N-terminal domain-containing protein [Yoonia sp.]|nr:Wzz/FepE/Etk N-terminal domain-containing protein [Yoonia sp.]
MDNINQNNSANDDEIDLRELFTALWRGKRLIIICVMFSIMLASLHLRLAERKYTVRYVFAPVASENPGPSIGGLGGLASLAGVSLPTGSSSDFLTYKFLLKSEEVAARMLKDRDLLVSVFSSDWDTERELFRQPASGPLKSVVRGLKNLLTGNEPSAYIPPNAARLSAWMDEAFNSSEDRDTGFLTLSAETAKPTLMVDVITRATQQTDQLLKERYIATAEQTMSFYQQQLSRARAREHREALAKLIAQEDQKLMLASKGSYFVAEPITEPYVSLGPTSPKASLVLALSVVLGGFLGAAIVLIKKAFK